MNDVPKLSDVHREVIGSVSARPAIVEDLRLSDAFQMLWRQKFWILGVVFLVTFFSWIGIAQLTPLYTASSQVLIGVREENVLNVEDVLAGISADDVTVENEIHVIRSRDLIGRTIDELGLVHDPEFNPALRPESRLMELLDVRRYLPLAWQRAWRDHFGAEPGAQPANTQPIQQALPYDDVERDVVIDQFLSKLAVVPEGTSLVIRIEITTRDPGTSQLVANTLTDFYIVSQLDAKLAATKRASAWLFDRLEQLRTDAMVSARAVEEFRRESGLLQTNTNGTLAEQEISQLNLRFVQEQTTLAETQARLRQVESLLQSPEATATASEVLRSSLIISLRQQESELERRLAEMGEIYGDRHPQMVATRAELADLKNTIRAEISKVVDGLRNEMSIARTRAAALERILTQRRQSLAEMNVDEVRLIALQREAESNQNLLEVVMARFKEISAQEDFQKADATILSRAALPRGPSFPNKPLMLGLAVVCSIFLSVLVAFAIDQSGSGLRSMEQIEQLMGMAPLGLVPALSEVDRLGKKPAAYLLKRPNSTYSEAIRTVYANLSLMTGDNKTKTLLITSSIPSEGKTSISVSLARALAIQGQKVMLLDCDFRRGTAHKGFGVSAGPGLMDYLVGSATAEEVTRRDPKTDASFISVGRHSSTALSFQLYKKLEGLMNSLKKSGDYHVIIMDSPPILAVSDSRMLAGFVDEALFVVRWAKTRREHVSRALQQLMGSGCKVGGIVLSMVDVKRHSQYRFGDSGLYTGYMGRYYRD